MKHAKIRHLASFDAAYAFDVMMKLYGKLWMVGDVERFQEVFVDCVEFKILSSGHYHAYKKGRVLHRDLSENNLTFKEDDELEGGVKGILNDSDMASKIDQQVKSSTARHRTGTLPFIARDLLVDGNPPPHHYRHDLESFFYILVWAALRYDFKSGARLPIPNGIQEWQSTMERANNAKNTMITSAATFKLIISHVQPQSRDKLVPWIISVRLLFLEASYAEARGLDECDEKTLGGWITFEKFMEALGREPRPPEPLHVASATS
ncbi:hypothetical protein H0H81_008134 [Sphagnurus paluster]|uniref:Protein kinase domain-containing protein n=1 Tax=Sphagnurus paluster TaxID=117069 RepID=A0A9P7FSU8_9AGAR|nr:hypothetical protein H0H81_008134 [Sphagnurus paluster]